MATPYLAKSLVTLRNQVNKKFPNRSKASDGWIGDTAHSARKSEHNANPKGAVRALDITHDPLHGFDSYQFAEWLRTHPDNRDYYIISNGRIANPGKPWRKYTGSNPHDHHVHISVVEPEKLYDDPRNWDIDGFAPGKVTAPVVVPGDRPPLPVPTEPILKKGSKGEAVKTLQTLLKIKADGDFGPATEKAVKAFQITRGLASDGVVGANTWRTLKAAPQPEQAPASVFDRVMEYVFVDEGEETNISPDEPGGASRYGVSLTAYSEYIGHKATVAELEGLTRAQISRFYKIMFWDKIGADKLPTGLNYAAFDFAINSGPGVVDQIGAGDYLTTALKSKGAAAQIDKLCDLRLAMMKSNAVKWKKYGKGWGNRVSRVRVRAKQLAGVTNG